MNNKLTTAKTTPGTATLLLLTGLSRLSLNMFIPSLPKIAETFGADYDLTAVSISGYLGMTAILQIVVGPCRTGSDGGWRPAAPSSHF